MFNVTSPFFSVRRTHRSAARSLSSSHGVGPNASSSSTPTLRRPLLVRLRIALPSLSRHHHRSATQLWFSTATLPLRLPSERAERTTRVASTRSSVGASVATAHHRIYPVRQWSMYCSISRPRSTVLASRALKPACGLCFIFLFSEYNQINANSKICTIFI
jgi:hypothetical protein